MLLGGGLSSSTSLVAFLAVLSTGVDALQGKRQQQQQQQQQPQQQQNARPLDDVLAGIPDLSTYYGLLKSNPDILFQIPSLSGVTLIAPSNEAFNKSQNFQTENSTYITSLLQYHIIKGVISAKDLEIGPSIFAPTLLTSKAYTNVSAGQNVILTNQHDDTTVITSGVGSRSTITERDIKFAGGLIQQVDTILVPPTALEHTARDAYRDLTGFLGALYSTGLVAEFSTTPGVTILAPRNAALQKIATPISAMSKQQLASVLRYHLIPNQVVPASSFFLGSRNFTSGALDSAAGPGKKVRVTRLGNNLFFNRAQLLQSDVLIANGVLHIIDGVLNPDLEDQQQVPDERAATQPAAFNQPATGAQTSTGTKAPVPFTSSLPCTTECPVPTETEGAQAVATTRSRPVSTRTSSGEGARCTGMTGMNAAVGMMAGVVGVGMQVMGVV
ncbi:FAS1 domain-containing protein [Cladorrhinum samala]|uniref:FAS1 domain-containing protein n=1 Tax=Cladorrhinum samala TaxID=585594 RepID=A0AAV9HW92_9PEZI|nr:FAS1 domain-containing protein [Cladorrhinum samala]